MISRRHFLKTAVAAAVFYPLRQVSAYTTTEKSLRLYNIHTGESLDTKYFASGTYDHNALDAIHHLLRCHYSNEKKPVDTGLLDLLSSIKDISGYSGQIQIISGYRSARYNAYLRNLGRGVAKSSLHLKGLAIDFAMPGISNNDLFSIAKSFSVGGVGKYSDFVHIDVGRVRYW